MVANIAPVIGAGIGAATFCIVVWTQVLKPLLRRRAMRQPFSAHFAEGPAGEGPCETKRPAFSEVSVQIRIWPKLHYKDTEFIFGFDGAADTRPVPIRFVNDFIKVGSRKEQSPDKNPNHYIDDKDAYHIVENKERTKGNSYAFGYRVHTRAPGRYPLKLMSLSDDGESRAASELMLIVEEPSAPALAE